MRRIDQDHQHILEAMKCLDILSELVEQEADGQYKHELDLDVILYGRGYAGGSVGAYVRLLEYEANDLLINRAEWAGTGQHEWDGNSFYILVAGSLVEEFKEATEPCMDGPGQAIVFEPGNVIGAAALLEGERPDASVFVPANAQTGATVLEFKRPALRLLRKYPKFSQIFNEQYRKHGRAAALRDV